MNVHEDGPGGASAIVLLHGFGGSLWWWGQITPLLADRFRVIRLDLLGHGATGGPGADAPQQAAAVEAELARLGVSGATVVGHSFGADVAVELAEHCDRVDAVVVVCQAPDYTDATLPRGRSLMTFPVIAPALHRLAPAVFTVASRFLARADREMTQQAIRDVRALDLGMFRVILRDRPDRMARRPLDAQLRDAGKPALVVLGGQDHFYGARSAARYESAGARVAVIERAGHSPTIDTPQDLADLIVDFVSPAAASPEPTL